ncbi:MAG: hypothetical protein S0880_14980 [Actinomycetota bacterium]|nr:hypothetical protein [Actinomycetota bacterium]
MNPAARRARDGGIDEIPLPAVDGRLWLCGKHVVGPDPDAALAEVGADVVVCLSQRHELEDRYPGYVPWLREHASGRALWWPVPDLSAPPLDDITPLFDELLGHLDGGRGLIVHCGAGIGRAGTVATCLLLHLGSGLDDALGAVARHRPMAGPESGAQTELVDALAARLAAGRVGGDRSAGPRAP